MKFRTKPHKEYKAGDTKVSRRFALWPKKVHNYIVWIGWYEYLYVYQTQSIRGIYNGQPASFTVNTWLKVSERAL